MSKETNEERKFTENIDHLLAGEKLEEIADISEDQRAQIAGGTLWELLESAGTSS